MQLGIISLKMGCNTVQRSVSLGIELQQVTTGRQVLSK